MGAEQPSEDSPNPLPHCNVVVLTALGVEAAAVIRRLDATSVRRLVTGTRVVIGSLHGEHIAWTIAVAEVGEGNVGTAIETTGAIRELAPDLVLFVGVAGGLKADLPHGTVVVASRVYGYQGGKSGITLAARPMAFPTPHALGQVVLHVRRLKWMSADPLPRVELKPIAAGERVVASLESEDYRILRETYSDAAAVDMESLGAYMAAERHARIPVIAIRGISDMIGDKTPAADEEWQPIAADNAAAFALALLSAIQPEDLELGPRPAAYADDASALLGSLPPPAAEALGRALSAKTPGAAQVLAALSSKRSRRKILSDLLTPESVVHKAGSGDIWRSIGEFAVGHQEHEPAAKAFREAAAADEQNATELHSRAALALAAGGNPLGAGKELQVAQEHLRPSDGVQSALVQVVEAAIAEDPQRIVDEARGMENSHPLIALIVAQALGASGRVDEGIAVGRRALAETGSRSMTGGLALITSQLLLARVDSPEADNWDTRDLREAEELGLRVRDLRRPWGGPSSDGAYVAAFAAFKAGDLELVLRYARRPPEGEATPGEAEDQRLIVLAAMSLIALRRFEEARSAAAEIDSAVDRYLTLVDSDLAEGRAPEGATDRLVDLLGGAEGELDETARFRIYLQLEELGAWPPSGVELVGDKEAVEIASAKAEVRAGDVDAGIRRLRRLRSPRGRAFLVNTLIGAGRFEAAIDELRDAASRSGQPRYRYQAALLLGRLGRYQEARQEGEAALAVAAPRSRLANDLRGLLVEVNSRLRDWSGVLVHALAAIADGDESIDMRWAVMWSHFSRRDLDAASRFYAVHRPKPRDEDDAILITQLLRRSTNVDEAVGALLALSEDFRGSERVSAAALMATFEVARDVQLPGTVRERIQDTSDNFFVTWPESAILTRIDASDINNVVAYLRKTLQPSAEALDDIASKVNLGHLPYGMLAPAAGRTVAEALIKVAAGCVATGEVDHARSQAEDEAAYKATDAVVVADTAAMVGVGRIGLDPSTVTAQFAGVLVASATLDDAFVAADALRLRSTSSMGWDAVRDRPVLVDVDPTEADAWAVAADALVERLRACRIDDPQPDERDRQVGARAVLAPVRLARERSVALWSDDRAMRLLALSEGVSAFGTISVIKAMAARGVLTGTTVEACLKQFVRNRHVDFVFDATLVTDLAGEERWTGGVAALVLSRPASWTDAAQALDVYQRAIAEAASGSTESVTQWAYAAALGAARRSPGSPNCAVIPVIVLSGLAVAEMHPVAFRALLAGARIASGNVKCTDPLVPTAKLLATSLLQSFPAPAATKAFSHVISALDADDRSLAFREFLAAQ